MSISLDGRMFQPIGKVAEGRVDGEVQRLLPVKRRASYRAGGRSCRRRGTESRATGNCTSVVEDVTR